MSDAEQRELIKYRSDLKAKLKKDFLRMAWDPYRHANEGGSLFDPAVQRFICMRASTYDYFKPTQKTALMGASFLLPFFIFAYFVRRDRKQLEEKCSTGKYAYTDRKYKLAQ